jgi:DNA-binding CsgD family transcriptional regulator
MIDLVALFNSGRTLREIARAAGVSHVTVKSRLEALGVDMRPKGRAPFKIGQDDAALSVSELMKKHGVSRSTAYAAKSRLESDNAKP